MSLHLDTLPPGGGIVIDEQVPLDDVLLAERDVRLFRVPLAEIADEEIRAILERRRDEEAFHIDYLQENWQRLSERLSGS